MISGLYGSMPLKKILLISSNSSSRGGGERYLIYLAEGLKILNYEVHVLISNAPYMDEWATEFNKLGIFLHRKPLKGLSQRPLRFLQALLDFEQIQIVSNLCKEVSPSGILVNQQYDEDGLDYIKGALLSGIKPVLGVMHMPMTEKKNSRPFGRVRGYILDAWFKSNPYQLVVVSEGSCIELKDYYKSHLSVNIINNGIPISNSNQIIKKNSTEPVIGFIGQLVPQKNMMCIIESWLLARKSGYKCKLLIVGDGPEREGLESKLRKHAPNGNWEVTGWLSSPEKKFQEIDIFIMTSNYEGLPLSLIEAAGRGITCLVTPFNGAKDVAQRASWVSIAEDNSLLKVSSLLMEILKNWNTRNQIEDSDLQDFIDYFSIERMAFDVSKLMGFH